MKKKLQLNFGMTLLIFSAFANMARWIGMFTIADDAPAWVMDIIPTLGAISGLVSGLSVAGGLAFIAHRLGALQPFTPKGKPVMRFWGSLFLAILIVVMSAFLLPPYVRMMTPERLRVEIVNIDLWSVMSVLVGDLIIIAVALSDSKSAGFTRSSSLDTKAPVAPVRSADKKNRSAKPSGRSADFPCSHASAGCSRKFATQNSANAHSARCKHKTMTLADNLFEKVETKK